MTEISIPNTINVLVRVLNEPSSESDLLLPLRTLQMRGFSKLDLVVFIERLRERNFMTAEDDLLEENCLRALDMVHGLVVRSALVWDAQHEAMSLLARCLDYETVEAAVPYALAPSDMLPPRPQFDVTSAELNLSRTLATTALRSVRDYVRKPSKADFYRMPRGAFSTRPAALMELPDRLAFEALAGIVETAIQDPLPAEVLWPRTRREQPHRSATAVALEWDCDYIVKADISNFYEGVDHSLLAVFLVEHAGLSVVVARAIEALLTSTMGINRGLPQGPSGSDILATAYLLPIDLLLTKRKRRFVRYADDYFFAADSVGDGKAIILDFEVLLRELGLSLNTAKTQVMRLTTFQQGLQHPLPPVVQLKEELSERRRGQLQAIENEDELAEVLKAAGIDEDTLFSLLYHRSIDLDDVVATFSDRLLPSLLESYEFYFHEIATELDSGSLGDLTNYEVLAREALSVLRLANTDVEVSVEDLTRVITWFPRLAPLIASLLAHRGDRDPTWARHFVLDHLDDGARVDWVDAWVIHAIVKTPVIANRSVTSMLRKVVKSRQFGPLSHLECVRALAETSTLTEPIWHLVFGQASLSIKSEMFFSAISNPEHYPWIENSLGVTERRLFLAVKAMNAVTSEGADARSN